MDCRLPGFFVHHHLPELAQTHVHRVCDAIQPSHPLSSPSPPAFNLLLTFNEYPSRLFPMPICISMYVHVDEYLTKKQNYYCAYCSETSFIQFIIYQKHLSTPVKKWPQDIFRLFPSFHSHLGENTYQGDFLVRKEKKSRKFEVKEEAEALTSPSSLFLHTPSYLSPDLAYRLSSKPAACLQ